MNPRTLAVLLVVLMATSVSALQLSVSESSLTIEAGETDANVDITITNDAAQRIDVESVTYEPNDLDVTRLGDGEGMLDAGNETTFEVTIDSEGSAPGVYTLTFTAEDNTSATASDELEVTVEGTFSAGADLELGGEDQERDETITGTITLRNDRSEAANNIAVTPSSTLTGDYRFNVTGEISDIDPFSTTTVPFELFVPESQDSGRDDLGQITFEADGGISDTINVFLETESGLRFEDIDVESDSDSDSNLEDGDEIDYEFLPGENVVFTIEIENILDIDIDDVEIEMLIEDIDDGRDLDEDSDREDIRDRDSEVFEIEFDIPEDAEEDTYDVVFTVIGDDENGAEHTREVTIELVVERERDDLELTTFRASPTSVCPNDPIEFDVEVRNIGSDNQDDALVEAVIDALDVRDTQSFEIEEAGDRDDEYDTTLRLIVPDDAEPGTYTVEGNVYYDNDKLLDREEVSITVRDCDGTDDGTDGEDGTDGGDGVVIIEPETPPPQPDDTDDDEGVDRSSLYVWLLVGLNVLVIVLILTFVVRLLTR